MKRRHWGSKLVRRESRAPGDYRPAVQTRRVACRTVTRGLGHLRLNLSSSTGSFLPRGPDPHPGRGPVITPTSQDGWRGASVNRGKVLALRSSTGKPVWCLHPLACPRGPLRAQVSVYKTQQRTHVISQVYGIRHLVVNWHKQGSAFLQTSDFSLGVETGAFQVQVLSG